MERPGIHVKMAHPDGVTKALHLVADCQAGAASKNITLLNSWD
jgi:hypothetical protein